MTDGGTSTPVTPHNIGDKIDSIISQLNNRYDLQLPRLSGSAATKAEQEQRHVELQISSRIRFLCFRTDSLQALFDDFDQQAKRVLSEWVFKPLQEEGTMPRTSRPAQASFLKTDNIPKAGKLYTKQHRRKLLGLLADMIAEEYKLAIESPDYQRISSGGAESRATSCASAEIMSFTSARSSRQGPSSNATSTNRGRRQSVDTRSLSPRKRESSGSIVESAKKKKTIDAFFNHTKPVLKRDMAPDKSMPPPAGFVSSTPPGLKSSFETLSTQQSDKIFSDDEDTGVISVETSMISSQEESQDYFPTQDAKEYLNDVSFTSNLDEADNTESALDMSLHDSGGTGSSRRLESISLVRNGPFRWRREVLPPKIPYWQKYEIHRFALLTGVSPVVFYDEVAGALRDLPPDVATFRRLMSDTARSMDQDVSFQHSDIREWTLVNNAYESSEGWKSTHFTGKLEFSLDDPANLFQWSLNPIKIDRSCRFHRHYGADRFMIIYLPYMTSDRVPKKIKDWHRDKDDLINETVVRWLATQVHHIAGRQWRAFFLEPDKSQSKKKRDEEGQRQKLHLFAIDADDLDPYDLGDRCRTTLLEFVNWHIPLDANMNTTDLKLFSRFSLGLSKTVPTVELQQSEVYESPGPKDDKQDMSDGCAKMSIELARAVWDECGDGISDLPSAFQARFAGAKGLWIVDYERTRDPISERGYWIEVAGSQLKIKPHPSKLDAGSGRLRFEVLKYSKPCIRGGLNAQLIPILEDRGVPRSILKDAMLSNIRAYINEARDAMDDPIKLRGWLQQYHPTFLGEDAPDSRGGLPTSLEAEICLLVESGFDAQTCPRLRKSLKMMMTQELNGYVDKMKIRLAHSTNVFCAPDLYGVLAPGEIHLGFSTEWENPRTGLPEFSLDQMDVLVARNPAHLASDVQKVRAVHKRELRHFKNVILFPTTGEVPLASLLSGGDYDGDTVAVIWDPAITDAFKNTEKPKLPSEQECGIENRSRQVSSYFGCVSRSASIDAFFESCFSFNAYGSLLGVCTSELEKIIYNQISLHDSRAIRLAALAGYLVDANKQGSWLSPLAWKAIRTEITSKMHLRSPQHKSANPRPLRDGTSRECSNVIDFLKFDVAQKEKDNMLKDFEHSFAQHPNYDHQLSDLFKIEERRSENKSDTQRVAIRQVITDLKAKLRCVVDQWDRDMANEDVQDKQYERAVEDAFQRVQAIIPLTVDCDIVRDFHREGGVHCSNTSRWSLLRASTMYRFHHNKAVIWHSVGFELCRIQARIRSSGDTRELVPSMHRILKADLGKIARLHPGERAGSSDVQLDDLARNRNNDHDDDEFFDAEE